MILRDSAPFILVCLSVCVVRVCVCVCVCVCACACVLGGRLFFACPMYFSHWPHAIFSYPGVYSVLMGFWAP